MFMTGVLCTVYGAQGIFHFVVPAFFACLTSWQSDFYWNQVWQRPTQYPVLARGLYEHVYLLFHFILNVTFNDI